MALYAADAAWSDVVVLCKDGRTRSVGNQLYRAVGSISANLAEGYSRSTGPDRARFYEYALGSARESRDWYHKARVVLAAAKVADQIELLTSIVRLLLVTVARERPSGRRCSRTAPLQPE
jgi:four helix bundle protein